MIEAIQLAFHRSAQVIFSDLTFKAREGECIQICGPNGSGKSTLLKVLAGLLEPTSGHLSIRESKYYLGHRGAVHGALTPVENLQYFAGLSGIRLSRQKLNAILLTLGLDLVQHRYCHELSQGQRQRVACAYLWLTTAQVWLLDEPFSALDSFARHIIGQRVHNHLQGGGVTVLTGHDISEVPPDTHIELSAC